MTHPVGNCFGDRRGGMRQRRSDEAFINSADSWSMNRRLPSRTNGQSENSCGHTGTYATSVPVSKLRSN